MARLPIPGEDDGTWGTLLNDFLSQSLTTGGGLKSNTVGSTQIQASAVGAAAVADGALPQAKIQNLVSDLSSKVSASRTITAGTGLSGGGDLSANRVLTANFGATAGTIAQGNDSRITGAEQTANKGAINGYASLDGTTKVPITQLPTGTGASQVALGNHTHPSGNQQLGVYPISAYGFIAASGVIEAFTDNGTISDLFACRIFIPGGTPITGAASFVRTAGTLGLGGENGFAIYEDDGTLAGATVSDDNLWTATGWRSKAFPVPIAAEANDRFVYACQVVNGYSAPPNILYNITGGISLTGGGYGVVNHRRAFYASASAWPASFNPVTFGNDAGGYIPLIGLA